MSVRIAPDRPAAQRRSDFARVGQGAATSLIGTTLASLTGLVITMLMTRTLGAGPYGAIAVSLSVAGLAQQFTNLGLANGAARMMAFARADGDDPRAIRLLRAGLLLGTLTGVVGTGAVLAVGAAGLIRGFGTSTALMIISPVVIASALRSVLSGALRAYRDLRAIFILGIARPAVDLLLVGGLVAAGFRDLAPFAAALVASAYVDLVLVTAFARRRRSIGPLLDTTRADLRTLLTFSVPLVVSQLLFFAIKSSDVLLLGVLRSPVEAGLYSPVMRLSEAASRVLSAFPVLFVPIVTAYVARHRTEQVRDLYLSATKWGYALGFPVILVLAAVPSQVLPLLFGPSYGRMDGVARILVAGYWVTVVTGLNGVTLSAIGAVKPMATFAAAGMAINLGLGLTLIPRFGPAGAAWSNTLSYLFVNTAYSVLLFRHARIHPFRRDTVSLFGFSGVVLALTVAAATLAGGRGRDVAIGVGAAGVAVWLAGALFGRPFRMEWDDIRQMVRLRRREAAQADAPPPGPDAGSPAT